MEAPARVPVLEARVADLERQLGDLGLKYDRAVRGERAGVEALRGREALLALISQAKGYLDAAGVDTSRGWLPAVEGVCASLAPKPVPVRKPRARKAVAG